MNALKSRITSAFTFLKENKPLVVGAFLVVLFLYVIVTGLTADPRPRNQTNNTTTQPSNTLISITVTPAAGQSSNLYQPGNEWSPRSFTEGDLEGISFTETQLPDGTTKYAYESTNPNRPNEIIIDKGTIVYQRSVINNKYIYNYTNTMGAPDYVYQSSKFYGANTMTYVYLQEGTAFVADVKTTLVKEQLSFKPTTLDQFKEKYAQDIADFTVIPTLPEEEYVSAEDNR
jgi:hypothetical protein